MGLPSGAGVECDVEALRYGLGIEGTIRGTDRVIRPVTDGETAEVAIRRFPALVNASAEELSPRQFRALVEMNFGR